METPDQTALILPFRRPPAPAAPAELQARLQQALLKLDDALAAQNSAVAAWRGSTADLGAQAMHLAETAASFQQALESLAVQMARLRDQSRRLAGPTLS